VVVAAGGGFDAETVAKIVEGCEGWPLGLRLALESARDGSLAVSRLRDIDDFFSRFTERAVPDDLLPLLYKTAILEELEAPLCDYVLETNRGKELIEHLERHKVFITSLDKQGLRHRYNRAFADWLQAKLLSLHDINYIHDLHSRAGVWYEEHHSYDIAARHAIAASDLDTIVQIVAPLDSQRQLKDVRQVLEYVSSVPTAEFSKTPLACLLATLAYTHQGRPANALKWVDILRDNYAALARMTP
jgi:LuxR family maltose regulon positive regulatory protein